jgi:hypothetical protein
MLFGPIISQLFRNHKKQSLDWHYHPLFAKVNSEPKKNTDSSSWFNHSGPQMKLPSFYSFNFVSILERVLSKVEILLKSTPLL